MMTGIASRAYALSRSLALIASDSLQGRVFDRLMGVSTRGIVVTKESNFVAGGDNCAYAACQWLPMRRALKELPSGFSGVFVDLGSGKGKGLLIAGQLPYRRVIGVEIDDELAAQARENIKNARPNLRASHIESITGSVLEWPIPDETSAVFLYNPFTGDTLRNALSRVFESYDRKPRDLHIVYGYPWEHDWLVSTGRVVVDRVTPSMWPPFPRWWQRADVFVTYRVVRASGEAGHGQPADPSDIRSRALKHWSRPNGHRFTMAVPGQQALAKTEESN
jgi:SAM-dependent methyltransferase